MHASLKLANLVQGVFSMKQLKSKTNRKIVTFNLRIFSCFALIDKATHVAAPIRRAFNKTLKKISHANFLIFLSHFL